MTQTVCLRIVYAGIYIAPYHMMSLSMIVVHTETSRNFSVSYKLSLYNNKSR